MRTAILASGISLGLLSFAGAMPAAFPLPPPRTVQIHGKGLRPPRLHRRQEPKRRARLKKGALIGGPQGAARKSRSTCEDKYLASVPAPLAESELPKTSSSVRGSEPAGPPIFEVPGFL
jgi:hypothetical protein